MNQADSKPALQPRWWLTSALSKFVVGYVSEMEDHPKSDHLHITKVDLGTKRCRSSAGHPTVENHVKVIVAKVSAMMPSGQIIWPGNWSALNPTG